MEDKQSRKINSQWIIYMLVRFFLGYLGIHRIISRKVGSGIGMLALQIIGFLTMVILIGFAVLGAAWIWWIVDGILISMGKFQDDKGNEIKMFEQNK